MSDLTRCVVIDAARTAIHHFDQNRIHLAAAGFARQLELDERTTHLVADWYRATMWLRKVAERGSREDFWNEMLSLAPAAV